MNFTGNRELIQKYITSADRVTSKNSSLPILNSVLLITSNNNLTIRSTNLEVGVEFQIPVEVKKEGSLAISGSLLSNILLNLPDEENINFSVN
jgi:DNA polymerase-3 subunit beta